MKESVEEEDGATATSMNVLGYMANVVLWSVVAILILDNIPGVEVNSLIASLGIGGVAVALAVQNILKDLFASLSIVLDRPFVIGDSIEVGDQLGTVERIGLHSSRIRSINGEELVYSNADLISSRIKNFKSLTRRRVQISLGIKGDTPYGKLSAIPGILQEIVETQEKVSFDRSHFRELGEFAMNFDLVYYVEGPDFNLYMDLRHAINLEITRRFEAEGIEFAFPTQTVILEQ